MFIGCHDMKKSSECEATKKFVETATTCGKKVGEIFILDEQFWMPQEQPTLPDEKKGEKKDTEKSAEGEKKEDKKSDA
jgi:hypothetical protein